MKKAKWAIRDVDFGKTYFFDDWDDLVMFIVTKEAEALSDEERQKMIEDKRKYELFKKEMA